MKKPDPPTKPVIERPNRRRLFSSEPKKPPLRKKLWGIVTKNRLALGIFLATPIMSSCPKTPKSKVLAPQIELSPKKPTRPEVLRKKEFYTVAFDVRPASNPEIPNAIQKIVIYAMHNGEIQRIPLSSADLLHEPRVEINGYVVSVFVFGSQEMKVQFAGRNANTMLYRKSSDKIMITGCDTKGRYVLPWEDVTSNEAEEQRIKEMGKNQASGDADIKKIHGFYNVRGGTVNSRGIPLSEHGQNFVRIRMGNKHHFSFEVWQKPTEECLVPACQESEQDFYYQGNDQSRLETIPNLGSQLEAVTKVIKNIRRRFRVALNKVNLRDYNKKNATAHLEEGEINLYVGLVRSVVKKQLTNSARHEMLHLVAYQHGLTKSPELRELFCKLKGYEDGSKEKESVMKTGEPPSLPKNSTGDRSYFNFIRDSNVVPGARKESGHPWDDAEEFGASTLHLLEHIYLLENLLNKPVMLHWTAPDGKKKSGARKPNVAERRRFVKNLIDTVTIMIATTEKDKSKRFFTSYFKLRLRILERINKRLPKPVSAEVTK